MKRDDVAPVAKGLPAGTLMGLSAGTLVGLSATVEFIRLYYVGRFRFL